ncbi:calmodulin-binding receptor-like cytoplasmic kinase 3 isoform X2 [Oryza brachyantha]|uniref:calmodulin-binding receptor-like cytoplasmic kinase 3 isoform X2 n=1 Tax=Oryza brachyantha TaxID=4533 RepID=UPI001ADACECC|nr:calmodulin-binding receptor-like cytoplasmic kinase 3 isoform X2 [Oryza brachyantha]
MASFFPLLPATLLVLLCSSLALASVSEPALSWTCGDDQVAILDTPGGGRNLSVNGELVHDRVLGCDKLRSYYESGCLRCGEQSDSEAWRGAWKHYCRQGSESSKEENIPRKLLRQPSMSDAKIQDDPCENMGVHGNNQDDNDALERQDHLLAVPVESISSFDVSTSSEKVPPTPHRIPPSPSRFAPSPQIARVGSVNLTVQQILRATQNFSPSFKLGEGGFGTVYRAVLPDGQVVAVKRAKKDQFAGPTDEFSNEVDLLAKIDHRNLVRLLGFTDKGHERIIITEYVPNGTLRDHLDGQYGRVLDFNQRLEIAIDVAHALTYLHLYAEKTIIHRDVKSSNILLTESFRAKVSDFGFARSGPSDTEKTHISTKVKGTAGYLDPEYLRTYQLTPKSDVFSFGILLVEILSARRPVELKRAAEERITIRWTFKKFNEGNMREILDPLLEDPVDDEVLEKLLSLAFQCAAPTREDRPTMKEVGEQLWEIRKEYGKSVRRV